MACGGSQGLLDCGKGQPFCDASQKVVGLRRIGEKTSGASRVTGTETGPHPFPIAPAMASESGASGGICQVAAKQGTRFCVRVSRLVVASRGSAENFG